MKKATLTLIVIATMFCSCDSCGNSSRRTSDYIPTEDCPTSEYYDDEEDGDYDEEFIDSDQPNAGRIQLTGRIETCNKCMGYGMVQNGMYGQPEICKFCWISTNMWIEQGWNGFDGRFGQVDAVFNTLPADYFDGLDLNGGEENDNGVGDPNSDAIEAEIARHEQNIAQIEHQLEYIEGGVNRTYLEQQLIEEQYEIKRLRRMLEN